MTIRTTSQLIKTEYLAMPSIVKHLTSSFVLATLLLGCASADKQGNKSMEADNVVMAANESVEEGTAVAESRDIESEVEAKAQTQADAMVASLAAKSKFDEPEKSVEPESTVRKEGSQETEVEPLPTEMDSESKTEVKVEVEKAEKAVKEVEKKDGVNPDVEAKVAPVKVVAPVTAKPLNATLSDLPIKYDIWDIRKGEATLDKNLVISTPTWDMGESGYLSQIWVTIMDDKLLVNSSSDIYAPKGKAGIKLNGGELVPFDRIVEHNIGVLEGDHWLDLLAAGGEIEIFMGFFPDRTPKSDIYKSSLELDSLARVAATYKVLK
jgi:hypothetical protein